MEPNSHRCLVSKPGSVSLQLYKALEEVLKNWKWIFFAVACLLLLTKYFGQS